MRLWHAIKTEFTNLCVLFISLLFHRTPNRLGRKKKKITMTTKHYRDAGYHFAPGFLACEGRMFLRKASLSSLFLLLCIYKLPLSVRDRAHDCCWKGALHPCRCRAAH